MTNDEMEGRPNCPRCNGIHHAAWQRLGEEDAPLCVCEECGCWEAAGMPVLPTPDTAAAVKEAEAIVRIDAAVFERALARLTVPPDPDTARRLRQLVAEVGFDEVYNALASIDGALVDAGIMWEPGAYTRFLATLSQADHDRFFASIGAGCGDAAALAYLRERMLVEPA